MVYKVDARDLKTYKDGKYKKTIFPDNKGFKTIENISIDENISLSKTLYCASEDIFVANHHAFLDNIYLDFFLDGSMLIDEKVSKIKKYVQKSHSYIYAAQEINLSKNIQKNQPTQVLCVGVNKDFVQEYFPHLGNISGTKLIKYNKTSHVSYMIAKELYNLRLTKKAQSLYLQSRVLELLYHEFTAIKDSEKKGQIFFSNYDLDAIKYAKEILSSSLDNPPSTKELSKIVRLNEYKLKIGFKRMYGTSIYQSVLDEKMAKIKTMLVNREINVNEAAVLAGYKYSSSFSLAFKKYFGTSPKNIGK